MTRRHFLNRHENLVWKLIGKRKDSIYEVGLRSGDWIKLKLLKEQNL